MERSSRLGNAAQPRRNNARRAQMCSIKRADLKKHAFDATINATPVGNMGNMREIFCSRKKKSTRAMSST